ncbi:MAG: alpha-glucan family phosphorylase [Bacteroidales bacterium]
MNKNTVDFDYLFEVCWEVCTNTANIQPLVTSKAPVVTNQLRDNYIVIGPDLFREEKLHSDFIESHELFPSWKEKAFAEGLRFRVGRCGKPGSPILILLDFTPFISQKNEIFSHFWDLYKLDSLSGKWDYIEPALFGYAAGKLIESFVKFNLNNEDKIVAHFHEWLTGTGILYIEDNIPSVATVFTTHSTVTGRSIAENNRPLYSVLSQLNAETIAREKNFVSKQSLEKLAANTADVYTAISDLNTIEGHHFLGRKPLIITPSGINESLIPDIETLKDFQASARKIMIEVARELTDADFKNPFIIGASGNGNPYTSGIDVLLESISSLNKELEKNDRDTLVFIFNPANILGPRKELLKKINRESTESLSDKFVTHQLHDVENDFILSSLKSLSLNNEKNNKIKLIYVPIIPDQGDGIFNTSFQKLSAGFDLSVFPAYYEPWGYSLLESLANNVPVIASSLTGSARWAREKMKDTGDALQVIERTDTNYDEVVEKFTSAMKRYITGNVSDRSAISEKIKELTGIFTWENILPLYQQAWSKALESVPERVDSPDIKEQIQEKWQIVHRPVGYEPAWNKMVVQSFLPESLMPLRTLASNLWWSWNYQAEEMFKKIDPELWENSGNNPIALLENVDYKRIQQLESDEQFIDQLNKIYDDFQNYMTRPVEEDKPAIAYFSMEYGLHNSVKIFSGGLGILAGDYLKEASDSNYNMVAVGLLYKYGYFKQMLSPNGDQQAIYEQQVLSHLPLEKVTDEKGNWLMASVVFPGRTVHIGIWKLNVGKVPLYLLDTDLEENQEQDRQITYNLYGGDIENRLKQELVLGIGGIRALTIMGIENDIFHSNEGHSAFIGLERLRKYINDHQLSFEVAKEVVRSSNLFTTHTPVPAGHDVFPEDLLRIYISHYPERLKISWDELLNLGRTHQFNKNEPFSMSVLAANLSQEMNGVSKLHGRVSQEMFRELYRGYMAEENHIGYVTNGVHYGTWTARELRELYEKEFGDGFLSDQPNQAFWKKIHDIPDEKIWEIKQLLRHKLITDIRETFKRNWLNRHESPRGMVNITENLDDKALTIGFARRFATYKRGSLLFTDPVRLARILNDQDRPVQFLFAGKAHPHDKGGQELIKKIITLSRQKDFIGKILFLENYDMMMAKKLVAGVDIWLNTPTRPLEASGTSGEKAAMNGTMHFSVLDGWWVEGYHPKAGWALPEKRTYDNQEFQNELDAETIYHILEDEIIPMFYDRNSKGVPPKWVSFIKHTISEVAPKFTMKRMLNDYQEKFYSKLHHRHNDLIHNDFVAAKDIALWKKMVSRSWDQIELISLKLPDTSKKPIKVGDTYTSEIILDLHKLLPEEIGVEFLVINESEEQKLIVNRQEYEYMKSANGQSVFRVNFKPLKPGVFSFGIRVFPKNKNLPHRQDFPLVKWV